MTRAKLDKLTQQAEQLKRALCQKSMVLSPRADISVDGSLFDPDGTMNGFSIVFYPDGKGTWGTQIVLRNQTPTDIKAFTDENPGLEYFIYWDGCLEWQIEHTEDPAEAARLEKMLLSYSVDFRTETLKETLRQLPRVMHYKGNQTN